MKDRRKQDMNIDESYSNFKSLGSSLDGKYFFIGCDSGNKKAIVTWNNLEKKRDKESLKDKDFGDGVSSIQVSDKNHMHIVTQSGTYLIYDIFKKDKSLVNPIYPRTCFDTL